MAAGIACDENDGPAAFMVTRIEDGDVTALCGGHFVDFCRAVADRVDHPTPEDEAGEMEPKSADHAEAEAAEPATEAEESPAGK